MCKLVCRCLLFYTTSCFLSPLTTPSLPNPSLRNITSGSILAKVSNNYLEDILIACTIKGFIIFS